MVTSNPHLFLKSPSNKGDVTHTNVENYVGISTEGVPVVHVLQYSSTLLLKTPYCILYTVYFIQSLLFGEHVVTGLAVRM